MTYPKLTIDLKKIEENTREMVRRCRARGITVAGVTKMVCGNEVIADILVDAGVEIIADARIENLKRMSNIQVPKMLLRIPMASQAEKIVKYSDISLVSELSTIKRLADEAIIQDKVYSIILMVDLGDLREGIFYRDEIFEAVEKIKEIVGIKLIGIGSNLTCYGGVVPTEENLSRLIEIRSALEEKFALTLDIISGGNSGSLSLFEDNSLPEEVNQLRLGASLLMGIGLDDRPVKGLNTEIFKLEAEIVEIRLKPSVPIGKRGLDAFGEKPVFIDRGIRKRAICALGKQDISLDHLIPTDKDIIILGGSSDHLILDITDSTKEYCVDGRVEFDLSYGGCLSVMNSEYINKVFL